MSHESTVFYRGRQKVCLDFNAGEISTDGSIILLEKLERKHGIIREFSKIIPDQRDPLRTVHSREKQLKQRVFALVQGYADVNDVEYLKEDPLYKDVLDGELASQPTMSRFENSVGKRAIFDLCGHWLDRYVASLAGRDRVVIDIDSTDDPTHGGQQLSMFNGYYGRFIYNELFFHDGETGQIILPVLRPGNSHSNRWYVSILKRVVERIRAAWPQMEILVRADSGFSCAPFYLLAQEKDLLFVLGLASNATLKKRAQRAVDAVTHLYVDKGIKYQHFISYKYAAGSWPGEQHCHAKVESTGKGINVRHIATNIQGGAREIYFGTYVKRGEASENRIKEVKNMCFSDRLSDHRYWANFFRLLISCIAYEMFLLIKEGIKKTGFKKAHKWQVDTIRASLLKVGGTIRVTKRRVYYSLSKAFVNQELFKALAFQ